LFISFGNHQLQDLLVTKVGVTCKVPRCLLMSKNLEADIFLTYQKNFSGTCVYTQCGDSTDPTILLGWCWEDHLSGWVGGLRHSDSGSFGHWTPPRWIFRFLQLKNLIARSHLLLTEDPFVLFAPQQDPFLSHQGLLPFLLWQFCRSCQCLLHPQKSDDTRKNSN